MLILDAPLEQKNSIEPPFLLFFLLILDNNNSGYSLTNEYYRIGLVCNPRSKAIFINWKDIHN